MATITMGRGLAAAAYESHNSPEWCPVSRIEAYHRVMDWIELGLYVLPRGSSIRDEADKVRAAACAHWRELRCLPKDEVLQY